MAKKKTVKKAVKKKAKKKTGKKVKAFVAPVHTVVSLDIDEVFKNYKKQIETATDNAKKEIAKICPELFLLGVYSVQIDYSGSGDQGAVDYIDYRTALDDKFDGFVPENLATKLKDAVWRLLPSGFENNDGGWGVVRIVIPEKRVTVEHEQRFEHSEHSEYEYEL
jgi:hypothetical protein